MRKFLTVSLTVIFALLGLSLFADKQPLMEQAIVHLEKAKTLDNAAAIKTEFVKAKKSLDKAAHNKGGHRVKAIKILGKASGEKDVAKLKTIADEAIAEVKAGIAFADEKKGKK